jgi:hypothetical protein
MKKILLVTMALLASWSAIASDAWIVKGGADGWQINVLDKNNKSLGGLTLQKKVTAGSNYTISMTQRGSGRGCRSGDCSNEGMVTTKLDKGVYTISTPVANGQDYIDASGNSHVGYSFTVTRLSDSDAKAQYSSLKY